MIVVSDTSPISNLLLAGYLHLLPATFGQVVIPERVMRELMVLETKFGYDLSQLKSADWLEVKTVTWTDRVQKLKQLLHEGESEAIALAHELQADFLLIDESEGRAVAEAEGIRAVGVLGLLLEAKNQHLILEVRVVMDAIIEKSKFWVSSALYQQVLQKAGEK